MTRRPIAASLIAAAAALLALGCAVSPPLHPAPGTAILIIDTEIVQEALHGTDMPVHTHAPAFVYRADGVSLYARVDGYRDAPWTALDPGRWVIVSEVRGRRRAVEVDLAAGERRVLRYQDIADGRPFDG